MSFGGEFWGETPYNTKTMMGEKLLLGGDFEQSLVEKLAIGNLMTVQATIKLLYTLGYAEPNNWSQPISTGKVNEVMVILTKQVKGDF